MLDSIEKDNQIINQIYKGKELVWQLPTVMTNDINLRAGLQSVVFNTYPGRCNVVVEVNGKEIANGLSSSGGLFSFSIDPPLKKDDYVFMTITKSGWGDLENAYLVY